MGNYFQISIEIENKKSYICNCRAIATLGGWEISKCRWYISNKHV